MVKKEKKSPKSPAVLQHEKEIQAKKKYLFELNSKLSLALKDYKLLTPELISQVTEALKINDYEECRDAYMPVIMNCFQFEATKIKASVGINKDERIDNIIKTTAGFFLIDVIKTLHIIEFGMILTITTTNQYISNTMLYVLEQVVEELKTNNYNEIIAQEIRRYLKIGGMIQPGDKEMTPFTPQKKERLQKLVQLYSPEFDGRLLSDISGEEV